MSPEYNPVNFETKTILVENKKVSYMEREGNGKTILMLPGWPWGKEMYKKLFKDLKDFHLIALDYPGWGESEPLDEKLNYELLSVWAMKFMDTLEIKKANLLGCSFGAAISLNIAYHYPDRIGSIIANAPPIYFPRHMEWWQHPLYPIGSKIPRGTEYFHDQLRQGKLWAWKILFGKRFAFKDDPFSQDVFKSAKATKSKAFFDSLEQVITTDIGNILPEIHVPVLLITGDQDYMLIDSEEAHNKIRKSSLVRIKGGTHHTIVDHSEEFAELAYNFFKLSEMSK